MNNKQKPALFGTVDKIPPDLPGPATYRGIDSAVFHANGERLDNPAVDYPDLPSLMAAEVPAGRYATCKAFGAIKFGPEENTEKTKAE